ncbi:hypothetical protein D3C76_912370 [compost metagenome]
MSRHAAGLIADLAPAVVNNAAVELGLGQVGRVRRAALPMEKTVQQRRVLIVLIHSRSCIKKGVAPIFNVLFAAGRLRRFNRAGTG